MALMDTGSVWELRKVRMRFCYEDMSRKRRCHRPLLFSYPIFYLI